MADNYLERREEALRSAGKVVLRRNSPSLDTLLLKNRSHRAYDTSYVVARRQLEAIVSVNTKIPSGRNAQRLRFKLLEASEGGEGFCRFLHLGGYLPELHLPAPGTEPQAFIVVCSTEPESPTIDIDLGISLQSMALKAVEIGLNALIVRAFDHTEVQQALGLDLEPLAVLALGKGLDKIELTEVPAGASTRYYRKDGVHYVPKIQLDDLLL
ncbi:MAG: nitroreductase family protein [Bacteroidales bacterium]|nr:nitroreductase family protein [Bacteroidales bacterium]MBP5521362.1 nitroreductase family protein [Bacteroidales bacterium]